MAILRRRTPFSLRASNDTQELLDIVQSPALNQSQHALSPLGPMKRSGILTIYSRIIFWVGIVLVLAPWLYHSSLHKRMADLRYGIELSQKEQIKMATDLQKSTDALRQLKMENNEMEAENKALVQELANQGDYVNIEDHFYANAVALEEAYVKRIDELKAAIRKRSERNVKEKYGMGPFRIRVTLKEDLGANGKVFVIQTSRLDVMPHSIDHFIQMVEQKLWDGLTLFHRNTGSHLIHALPLLEDGKWSHKRFVDANLTKLTFAEHSELQPIEKYSVCFHGRLGGPEFYINMEHNFSSHEVDGREACFGEVTDGRAILDYIMAEQRKSIASFVAIIEAVRLISNEP
jgi:cyclophilin family peptidyl-prolyl cis-trans isomerase